MAEFGTLFGELIARKREQKGWSFSQLAVAAYGDDGQGGETRKSDVQKLERGRSRKPNAATILRFRKALELSDEEINACRSKQEIDLAQFAGQLFHALHDTAKSIGVSEFLLAAMAERYAEGNEGGFSAALNDLQRAISVAAQRRETYDSADSIDEIVGEVSRLNALGRIEEASETLEKAIQFQELKAADEIAKYSRILSEGINQAIISRDVRRTAELVEKHAELEKPGREEKFWELRKAVVSWGERGRDKGLNFDLDVSGVLARRCVDISENPSEVGVAATDLGLALKMRGERSSNPEILKKSVMTLEAVSKLYNREKHPVEWAKNQHDLAGAFGRLGERVNGVALLEKAVAAHRAALEIFTKSDFPEKWFDAQVSLGSTLFHIAERDFDPRWLDEAVDALSAVIERGEEVADPVGIGMAKINLGSVLFLQGQRGGCKEAYEKAVVIYQEAAECLPKETHPLEWAKVQSNLAATLTLLADHDVGVERLETAISAHNKAIEVRSRDEFPIPWAISILNLSSCYIGLFDKTESKIYLGEAQRLAKSALDVFEEANADHYLSGAIKQMRNIDRLRAS